MIGQTAIRELSESSQRVVRRVHSGNEATYGFTAILDPCCLPEPLGRWGIVVDVGALPMSPTSSTDGWVGVRRNGKRPCGGHTWKRSVLDYDEFGMRGNNVSQNCNAVDYAGISDSGTTSRYEIQVTGKYYLDFTLQRQLKPRPWRTAESWPQFDCASPPFIDSQHQKEPTHQPGTTRKERFRSF